MGTEFDRAKAVKEFDDTKAGVKGVADLGLDKIPRIFLQPPENRVKPSEVNQSKLNVPMLDLQGVVEPNKRSGIVGEVLEACKTWGFFQIVNHGIPIEVLDGMLAGIRRFHELPTEFKTEFYSRDTSRKVRYASNYDLFKSRAANWRDTLNCSYDLGDIDPQVLPEVSREAIVEYVSHLRKLSGLLSELLSEALGLPTNHLKEMDSMKALIMACHYYPGCPEPELTMGASKHTDAAFLTILLQDTVGALQVLHQGQWVDVVPMHGALVINIGDLLQITSNDIFKSVQHRVLARSSTRVSIATFLNPIRTEPKMFGPIKELLSDANPPIYRQTKVADFVEYFFSRGIEEYTLNDFKILNKTTGESKND